MLIPPWIIDDLEDEQRDEERPVLRLPLEDARPSEPPTRQIEDDPSDRRGVMIVDISPASDCVIRF